MEEVVYESPTSGYRVEFEVFELYFDRSVRNRYWASEGFYSCLIDAEEQVRHQERQGSRVRIVKVEA